MGTAGIGPDDYFVTAESLGGGNYTTVKSQPEQVSEYVLNPITATQVSGYGKNYFFNNVDSQGFSSWTKAGSNTSNFPYLQVDLNNGGRLVTGSGISVPAIGDDMGDCVATTHLDMSQYDIINANIIYFDGTSTSDTFIKNAGTTNLTVKAENDLIVSGGHNIILKGQGIALNDGGINTPLEGEVRVTGGNLEVDPSYKLKVSEIEGVGYPSVGIVDANAAVSIKGAFRSVPYQFDVAGGSLYQVDWADSNVQYRSSSNIENVDFYNSLGGQTLTLYVTNSSGGDLTPTFRSGLGVDNLVRWGGDDGVDPVIKGGKTNVYTFVNINQRIFASAITGYVY